MNWNWRGSENPDEDEALHRAIDDIDASPDRSAAIVAAALVEDALAAALKTRFHQDEKTIDDMFRSSGPLGSFSAKINLAYLLGLCSKEACKELDTIKQIRNEFAHEITTADFDSQRVRDLANNLTYGDKCKITMRQTRDASGNPIIHGKLIPWFDYPPSTTPRERYIRTCQIFMFFLNHKHNRYEPSQPIF